MNDERLLVDYLSQRNDPAFEALVRRHGPMVLRVCRDHLGDPGHAEDAFQATFLVFIRRAGEIRERESLGRWLYAVACRIARRERRRLMRLGSQERQVPEMEAVALPDFTPEDRELKPILHEEIARLPARIRDAIVLCYFEGQKVEDAARRIGCPVATLKSRLGKGRELLRSRLVRRGMSAAILPLLFTSLAEHASAEVPVSLLNSTLKYASERLGGDAVSRQVASMILREEARKGWVRLAVPLSLLLLLLLILGAAHQGATSVPLEGSSGSIAAKPTSPKTLPILYRTIAADGRCEH